MPNKIHESIITLKELICQADKKALATHNGLPEDKQLQIFKEFDDLIRVMNQEFEDRPEQSPILGKRIQEEIYPFMLMTENGSRWYEKPLGYSGDYLAIKRMYENTPNGTGRIGDTLDQCFLNLPACKAVQNRKDLVRNRLIKEAQSSDRDVLRVTSLACGPAEEIFEAMTLCESPTIKAELIDGDKYAIEYLASKAWEEDRWDQVNLHNVNLFFLAKGRRTIDIEKQDFVYSIGVLDYLSDRRAIDLINYSHKLLRKGGKAMFGNFHPKNTTKAFMDHVLEWQLVHRSEDDMARLFLESDFQSPFSKIYYEESGINLFAECVKTS